MFELMSMSHFIFNSTCDDTKKNKLQKKWRQIEKSMWVTSFTCLNIYFI